MKFASAVFGLALMMPLPVLAAEHGAKAEQPASVPSVNMPMLVAPVTVKGLLARYVYLGVTLILPDDSNKMMLLEKIPYLQDAFLREVHGASIIIGDDPAMLDVEGLGRRLMSACTKIVGPDIVKKVELRDTGKDFQ